MDPHLHGLFAEALDDEPLPPPDDLARSAMQHGTTLRRRRRMRNGGIAGGALVTLLLALNLATPAGNSARSTEPAALPVPGASRCVPLSDVAIFLSDNVTEKQRAGLRARLAADPRVQSFTYESREQAFQKFVALWRDSPDFVKSVNPTQIPEAYRVRLTAPAQYKTFIVGFVGQPGVAEVTPDGCVPGTGTPAGSPAEATTEGAK